MERNEFGTGLGQMPGMNDAPLNPSFREGPESAPRHIHWLTPVVTILGFTVVLVALWLFG